MNLLNVSPRIFDRNEASTKRIVANQGGTSCFGPDQQVRLFGKILPISKVLPGARIWTLNEKSDRMEVRTVLEVLKFQNIKPTIKIKLKNGKEIICTEDHEFYFEGGWVSIKHILSLLNGKRNLETNTGI